MVMMWRRWLLCLFAVWVLVEASTVNDCLVRVDGAADSYLPCVSDDELPGSDLHIQCTSTEVTARFTYSGSDFYSSVTAYGVIWICLSASGREVYECSADLLTGPNVTFSLNITEREGWGSSCTMQGCVTHHNNPLYTSRSNECEIGTVPATTSTVKNMTTVTTTIATDTDQTTVIGADPITVRVTEDKIKIQDSNTDILIMKVLAPLIGVLIVLILLVIVVIVPLVCVITLRMRKFSHNWQAYGNPELPFDPHYAPVDIEKPSFSPTPRLSLLSVDMFQNLYMARTNNLTNGNLYTEPPSVPNICFDQSDSCSTLDTHGTGEESGNERISSTLSEVSIPHTCTSLDDDDTACKTVSESSYQSPNIQYIQHVPLLRKPQSLKDDYQDDLQANLSSDLDYADSALVGITGGDASCDNVSDDLHFWEQNSVPLPSLSDHFTSLCADSAEINTVQLDKAYIISSESGYIQSHDTNYSAAQSLFIEEDTDPDLDTPNQRLTREAVKLPAQIPLIKEQQSLESPTALLDNESMKSMDSILNCYGIGEHTQTDNSEEEVDVLGLYESDTTNYGEHHGYIEHEQHNDMLSETGLIPYPLDIDLDFIPALSGPVRPTSIDIRLTSDYTPSDLSSGYITTSCMSHDDGQNMMELLFQQKLKDVKEEFSEIDTSLD